MDMDTRMAFERLHPKLNEQRCHLPGLNGSGYPKRFRKGEGSALTSGMKSM